MTNVNTLIIEENLTVALALEMFILNMGCNVMAVIDDPDKALCFIRNNTPDLIFININNKAKKHYPELIQNICSQHIPVLFIPRHKMHRNGLTVARKQNELPSVMATLGKLFGGSSQTDNREDCTLKNSIFLKKGYLFFKVPFSSIIYIKADGDYCEFQTTSGKFIHKITLTKLLDSLSKKYFLRVHKSYIVHLQHIENVSLSRNEVTVNNFSIPVSKTYKAMLLNCIQRIH